MLALVTSSPSGDDGDARELAGRFGLVFEPRRGRRVDQLLALAKAPVLLLGSLKSELFLPNGAGAPISFRATMGIAMLRFTRARLGEIDPLVRAADLRPGERVIDATLGLGGDALIAAHATGATLLGIEKSPLLAAFTQIALRQPGGKGGLRKAALEAGARTEVRSGDHKDLLAAMPDKSADVVLFDPMFRSTVDAAPLFDLVRTHAELGQLSLETLRHARRVARRGVLIKDSPRAKELRRLGIEPIHARRFLYGWVDTA